MRVSWYSLLCAQTIPENIDYLWDQLLIISQSWPDMLNKPNKDHGL